VTPGERGPPTPALPVSAGFQRLVASGVSLAIGILVFNEVIGALPQAQNAAVNFQTAVLPTIQSAFDLAPVSLIVLVAALILRQLTSVAP
jgi:hypothetical protein